MEAIGPVLIVLSVPLIFRWIPPNRFYGFRIPPTCRDRTVWYDANALCARHMILLGLLLVALEFVAPLTYRVQTLRGVAIAGLAYIVAIDWRTALRWEREGAARSGKGRPGP